jgi:hypothetical protein
MFSDNANLLSQMFYSQSETRGQSDWEAIKNLFSAGIKRDWPVAGQTRLRVVFVAKLQRLRGVRRSTAGPPLAKALQAFVAGAIQMVSLGRLSLETSTIAEQATSEAAPVVPR